MKADFNKIIQEGRERKANEKLANSIFSKNRRRSAPSNLSKTSPATAPSLASRITKKGQRASLGGRATPTGPAAAPKNKGNINGEWTHDLHGSVANSKKAAANARPGSLASRITNPSAPASRVQANRKLAAKRSRAFDLLTSNSPSVASQVNITKAPEANVGHFTIRGLAGPYCVMAQNFARGTTAADVESAMTPIGGPMESCRVIKEQPFVLVEMYFSSKDGAERVVGTFDGQTADGMVLRVWQSTDGAAKVSASSPAIPTGPRAARDARDQVIDGSLGFYDLQGGKGQQPQRGNGLYSDDLVGGSRGGQGRGGRYR